jgi:putative transposase
MSNYRRSKTGHLFFFTVVTWKRRPLFGDPHIRAMLGDILREVRARYPFENEAFVLMPDHLHAIWRLPDTDYSLRWALIKKEFTKKIRDVSGDAHRQVWQKRFWEHTLRDDRDFENHCHYIHYNPVKHGYVTRPVDWEFSSFHRFVALGRYTPTWCASESSLD